MFQSSNAPDICNFFVNKLAIQVAKTADPLTIRAFQAAKTSKRVFTGNIANAQYFQSLTSRTCPEIVIGQRSAELFGIPVAYCGRRRSH
jgi:hypothetical protein